uniref:G_PROTEIN_RECEP_F1_2 domain-containing protein n=1 Tax=Caenorhabditis tropicalis TaxID=1561998 RepID=A0A1I7U7A5_9PELO
MVHEYRGGAFIIAYTIMLIAVGYPVLYLELIIGQFHRCSSIVFIRRCVPILQGFGYMALLSAITVLYPYQYMVARAFKFSVSLAITRSQNGAMSGIKEMMTVEWAELLYSSIWMDALNLVIQSLSIGIGGHSIMSSFAPKKKYTYQGGPAYIQMIQDFQKIAAGLFITIQLLIVLEFYGLDMIYEDMYDLMGHPSINQWSRAYSWSIWKWRWRMAPALSLAYVVNVFIREYPSHENDLIYFYYYDNYLPDVEPEDPTEFWKNNYLDFSNPTDVTPKPGVRGSEKPVKPQTNQESLEEERLSFQNYMASSIPENTNRD